MPGPGNYNPADSAAKGKPPAFTMRVKTHIKTSNEMAPGPGAYNPKFSVSKENLGNVKIGTSKRDTRGLPGGASVPGPGQYTLSGTNNGPSFGIGSSHRDGLGASGAKNTPGPGHYKVPTYIANLPKYTMPDRADNLRYI